MPKEKPRKFRLKLSKALLTYKTHIDKKKFTKWLNRKFEIKEIEIAHETGDEKCNYLHTHACVWFKKQITLTSERALDYPGEEDIHPNIKILKGKGKRVWEDALGYLSKEDPECKHLEKYRTTNIIERIWGAETIQEALKDNTHDIKEAMGVIAVFKEKELISKPTRKIPLMFSWQKDLKRLIKEEINERKVRWFVDEVGATGKSEFLKHMMLYEGDKVMGFRRFGGAQNASHLVLERLKKGQKVDAIICDFPRKYENIDIYEVLEDMIDGVMTSTKYMGGDVFIDTPHVIVLANFLPDVTNLSLDRWIIKRLIKQDHDVFAVDVPVEKAKRHWEKKRENEKPKSVFHDVNQYPWKK